MLAFPEPAEFLLAAVAGGGAPHVELEEAGLVGRLGLVAPQHLALLLHGGAIPVEAIPAAVITLHGVLHEQVLRTLPAEPGAHLGEVPLVLSLPADGLSWS